MTPPCRVGAGLLALALLAQASCAHTSDATPGPTEPGGLTADQIRTVISAEIDQVQSCYERALARDATASGRVVVAFVIAPDGSVRGAELGENALDRVAGECIRRAVSTWRFPTPEPAGDVSVRFPFNLSQSGARDGR